MNAPLPRSALAFALPAALILAACTSGPPVPSPIDHETVCNDYEIVATHAKMHGGMRRPVVLTVLADKKVVAQKILTGLASPKSLTSVVTIDVMPTTANNGVHDRSVSTSVTPPILLKTQKPASFIHEPMSEPAEIAVPR